MPFILLLVGLLGGALVCLLVISTTLAQGAFRITNLQEQNANLARQEQILTNEVAQAGNPAVIAAEAKQLGMRPNPYLGFIDLKTGKIVTGKPSAPRPRSMFPGTPRDAAGPYPQAADQPPGRPAPFWASRGAATPQPLPARTRGADPGPR